jgi:predicted O-linked N-acetylglucosamine transferase (SPINDLY family)
MATIQEAFDEAVRLHQAGRLQEADKIYGQILAAEPGNAEVWNGRGILAAQVGQHDVAVRMINRALELQPNFPEACNNLGLIYAAKGMLAEATAAYERATGLRSDYAEAHHNLGDALRLQGRTREAVACYQRAIEIKPSVVESHCNLGSVLVDVGKFEEAAACFRRALDVNPKLMEARFNLGSVLLGQGRLSEAAECFRRVIAQQPALADAYISLAASLQGRDHAPEAIECSRRAIELEPNSAEAHINLGGALKTVNRPDEAIACFRRALELNPALALAHVHLGSAFKAMGQMEDALASYQRAIELDPNEASVRSDSLFALQFISGWNATAIYDEHRRWNERCAAPLGGLIQPHGNDRSPDRRLRVGYVSPDFRNHCQALFTTPLFAAHDHAEVEVICYSGVNRPDRITERLRLLADGWREITGLSDDRACQLIRQDKVDILVDLTMHMGKSRPLLFARKPAPVQVCWLAYPGTTGLTTIDYRLTDPYLDPPGMFDSHYSEQSWRLPDTFWCYDPLREEPAVNALPAATNGYITFGCLNNFCKVNDGALRLWARVMTKVHGSRLLLLTPQGSAQDRTLGVFEEEGITRDRIRFTDFLPRRNYLAQYHQIDIGLDTVPYNGHTTSLDSYWMGVPVVTLVGATVVGRAGLSQLTNLGLPELVAQTPEQYLRIATDLATDLLRLIELRATLRERMTQSPLMDAPRFARNIEAAYRDMWKRWCNTARA